MAFGPIVPSIYGPVTSQTVPTTDSRAFGEHHGRCPGKNAHAVSRQGLRHAARHGADAGQDRAVADQCAAGEDRRSRQGQDRDDRPHAAQGEVFNEVVREQTSKMEIGERYQQITNGFNSIRDDSKRLVDQVADGKIDMLERGTNIWMKIARGDIADRFDKIRGVYLVGHQGDQEPDRARGEDPRRLSRLSRRAEARRGDGARDAEEGRGQARGRQEGARRGVGGGRPASPAPSRPSAPSSNSRATRSCAGRRRRRSATRSPRTSPTT